MSTISQSPGAYAKLIARLRSAGGVADGPNGAGTMAIGDPTTMAPPQAAPSSYGVFGQGYAGALQADAADPFYGAAAEGRLSRLASGETNDYDRRLQQQNAQAAAMQQAAIKYGLFHEQIAQQGGKMLPGELSQDADGMTRIDPVIEGVHRVQAINEATAGIHHTNAQTAHELYSAGVNVDPTDVNAGQGDFITGAPAGYGVVPGRANPNDQAALNSADASMLKAQADMIDAKNPRKYSKSGGSGGGYSVIVPVQTPYGNGMGTFKGEGDPSAAGITGMGGDTPAGAPVHHGGAQGQDADIATLAQHGWTPHPQGDGSIYFTKGAQRSRTFTRN